MAGAIKSLEEDKQTGPVVPVIEQVVGVFTVTVASFVAISFPEHKPELENIALNFVVCVRLAVL